MRALLLSKPRHLLTAVILLAALPCLAGCGPANKVMGKVTYKGKPVPAGMVVFYGANNWTSNSAIEEDGSYTIVKPPTGTVKITVDTSSYRPAQLPANAPKQQMGNMQDMSKMPGAPKDMKPPEMPEEAKNSPLYNSKLQANRYLAIPAKYADPEKTDLTYEVKPGIQTHDIDLK